jgi:hypothetical protein
MSLVAQSKLSLDELSHDELYLEALSLRYEDDAEGQHDDDPKKIKPYCLRIASIKLDDDCKNVTHRKYALNQRKYYEKHVDLVRNNSKDKYHNDPEFRKKKLEGMKIRRDRIRQEKLEKKKMDDL